MLCGARAAPGSMISAVCDANIPVSAFLSRDNATGLPDELPSVPRWR